MHKLLNCFMISFVTIMALIFSLSVSGAADYYLCAANMSARATAVASDNAFGVINCQGASRDGEAYYSGILGGKLTIKPSEKATAAYAVSIRPITIEYAGGRISISADFIHTIGYYLTEGGAIILVDGEEYDACGADSFTIGFSSYGSFGDFEFADYVTYHDSPVTAYLKDGSTIMSSDCTVSKNTITMTPKPVNLGGDTVTLYSVLTSDSRLFCYRLTNKHIVDVDEAIDKDTYRVKGVFDSVESASGALDANISIEGGEVKLLKSGDYTLLVRKGFCITRVNLTVSLPRDNEGALPAPPDDNGSVTPDGNRPEDNGSNEGGEAKPDGGNDTPNEEITPPDDNNGGNSGSIDNNGNAAPDEGNNSSGGINPDNGASSGTIDDSKPPVIDESVTPDDSEGTDIPSGGSEADPDNSGFSGDSESDDIRVEYVREPDYVKIAIVSSAAFLFLAGLGAAVYVAVKLAKRKNKNTLG